MITARASGRASSWRWPVTSERGRGALLGLPEIRVGIPSVIEAALLPGMVGPGRRPRSLLTGRAGHRGAALEWGS